MKIATKSEWYHALGRCIAAAKMHPGELIAQWPNIEYYCERRRAEGASPYAIAAELWPV